MSCLASIESELERKLKTGELTHPPITSEHWKFLTDADATDLLGQIKGYDCSPTHDASLDVWGNKIKIALRQDKGPLEVRAWYAGPDGEFETDDDLVFPYGREIPK